MINKTLNDETQIKLLPILQDTEHLFFEAIRKENNGLSGEVTITAMPDLGLANNVIRMRGGFYTGMFLEWESKTPIVPIDTTINSCGVAIFILKKEMSVECFKNAFTNNVKALVSKELAYNWNFESGNHFITLGRFNNGKNCIVMHASADEYKQTIKKQSLYPETNVWYNDSIKTITSPLNEHRYLRYLSGGVAEKFISIATKLEKINHNRMLEIANFLFSDYLEKEFSFVSHYGMPTSNSIAIGCSWNKKNSILLTAPGKNIYIIKSDSNDNMNTENWLTPHGFGVSANISDIRYEKDLYINNKFIKNTSDVIKIKNRTIRCKNSDEKELLSHIDEILSKCNAKIDMSIQPIATLSAEGFDEYCNKEN